jgi:nitroreductase
LYEDCTAFRLYQTETVVLLYHNIIVSYSSASTWKEEKKNPKTNAVLATSIMKYNLASSSIIALHVPLGALLLLLQVFLSQYAGCGVVVVASFHHPSTHSMLFRRPTAGTPVTSRIIQKRQQDQRPDVDNKLYSILRTSFSEDKNNNNSNNNQNELFDQIIASRYACTRFQRFDGTSSSTTSTSTQSKTPVLQASNSNPAIVKQALHCLNAARRSPSGFNAQPYRLLMIHDKSKKEQVASFCLGRNADRVRDSDVTVLFLADKQCLREYNRFNQFLDDSSSRSSSRSSSGKKSILTKWNKIEMQIYILLFSSGFPLPRFISNTISFLMRSFLSMVSAVTRRKILLPSLGTSETWSIKNTMLVAMTYMLSCTANDLQTCPMEGFNVGGIRSVLGIPRRFAIPLIVSTGNRYVREVEEEGLDDVGMEHGPSSDTTGTGTGSNMSSSTLRYPMEEVIFTNQFGSGDFDTIIT